MSFLATATEWVADRLSASDFIELYFVLSDLVDINLTDAELCETASMDSLATSYANNPEIQARLNAGEKLGKMVI